MQDSIQPQEDLINIASRMQEMAARCPYQRAVVYPKGRDASGKIAYVHLTFQQLDRESDCIAAGLEKIGIQRGIRTILMVKPSCEFFTLTFALFKAGIIPVVVDPGMGIQRMLRCLQASRAEALIGIPPAHALRVLRPSYFKGLKQWVTVGRRWFWGGPTLRQIGARPWAPYPIVPTKASDQAAILFTTGSTGPAKGVVYTHGIFDAQVQHIQSHFNIEPGEIDLPTFPLFALFDPALGMTAIIPDMDFTQPAKADPRKLIEAALNHGVTNMFASPALLNRLGRFGKKDKVKLTSLKRVVSAGAPVAPAIINTFTYLLKHDVEIHTPYGATEAMPTASIGSHEILAETQKLSDQGFGTCVGRPFKGIDIRIIEITDNPIENWHEDLVLPPGQIGEIAVKGNIVTHRYFERPLANALAKIKEGDQFWHRMGDLGWMDQKGRLWFCGRKNHRVVTAEGTLYSVPCEAIFNQHPRVFRSALVGVGPQGQQTPVICIELEADDPGTDLDIVTEELISLGRQNPMTESIQTLLFHEAFPVDIRHNAKIFRENLADWAAQQLH
jgi:acyl-CoA synthetase (AMP-forming)/AMP-acid ligase II